MNTKSLTALIALNVALLAALLVSTLTPASAVAQARTGRAEYTMVAGAIPGRSDVQVIYIVDTASNKVVPVLIEASSRKFTVLDQRDLAKDMANTTPTR